MAPSAATADIQTSRNFSTDLSPPSPDNHPHHPPSPSPTQSNHPQRKQSLDYALRSGLAGGLAGCAAKTVVAPLDRIKILLQTSSPAVRRHQQQQHHHHHHHRTTPLGFVPALADLYAAEGVRGLFRGHSATLLRIFPYAAVKFVAYEQVRALLIRGPDQETAWRRLVAGSAAGVTSVLLTYPLEVVRVRMAYETSGSGSGSSSSKGTSSGATGGRQRLRSGLRDICTRIYGEPPARAIHARPSVVSTVEQVLPKGGLANFYRGFAPTLLGMLPYAGTSFLTHDTMGDWLRHPRLLPYTAIPPTPSSDLSSTRTPSPASSSSDPLDPHHHHQHQQQQQRQQSPTSQRRPVLRTWAELLSGGTAGLLSQTASYPLEVVRRRMQVGGAVGDGHRLRIGETARMIWAERGPAGFFAGLGVGYVKVVPMVAVSFWVYERGKLLLGI